MQLELSVTRLRRGFDAASARVDTVPGAADAPRAAPFSRAEGSYNILYLARIANTRSDTQWARGSANWRWYTTLGMLLCQGGLTRTLLSLTVG